MSDPLLIPAEPQHLDAILPVVRSYYRHFAFPWDEARKREVLNQAIFHPEIARLWAVYQDGRVIGYALVTYALSLEFDGRVAVLDEFYILEEARGRGCGSKVLTALTDNLTKEGIKVFRLEVLEGMDGSSRLYARHGFEEDQRRLWTLRIDRPRSEAARGAD